MGRIVKAVLLREFEAWPDLPATCATIAKRGWFRYLDENGVIIQRVVENVICVNNDSAIVGDIHLLDEDIRDDGFMRLPITGWVASKLIDENPLVLVDFPAESLRGVCGAVGGMVV